MMVVMVVFGEPWLAVKRDVHGLCLSKALLLVLLETISFLF
jgi:hypothetical protein